MPMRITIVSISMIMLLLLSLTSAGAFEYDISVPETVSPGEWFSVNVSVASGEEINFSVYSYIYKKNNSVGQGWIANRDYISLSEGDELELNLEDLVKYGTEDGVYNLRVRFKLPDNETITETYSVKVVSKEDPAIKEIYLYSGLIAVSIVGVALAIRYNR